MERDDIIEYSLDTHHSEEHGAKARKKIWFVFTLLLIVTAVEVAMGALLSGKGFDTTLKVSFIVLTIVKAYYIIMNFMHLGEERKGLKWVILVPYILFIIYLYLICMFESTYINDMWKLMN
ncbi:MAG: cytochrome c oxidase subunit 4 [Flavobacteriales bacterium]|jgi:cytochrome c oxidase subunit 4